LHASRESVARILVVDDDADVRAAVRAILEDAGHEVVEAVDGAAGLRAYRDARFELVLCDLFMPDVDGIELIRTLRRGSPNSKVIAMSGGSFDGTLDLLDLAPYLGAVEVLPKPFSLDELVRAIERGLRSSEEE
jgi:CheY-like chemotaxis protein